MSTFRKHNARRQPGEVDTADNGPTLVSFPRESTVKARVLADLLEGRSITHLDTWREHGSSRLAHHVYALRGLGWPIIADDILVSTRDGQRQAAIARYRLPAASIERAGERGQEFLCTVRGGQ